MERINFSSNTKWEEQFGYSRAVKVGNQIFVSGTTSVNEKNEIIGIGNPYEQVVKAHSEAFMDIKPAATLVEIKNLINSDLLVEIEIDAVIY